MKSPARLASLLPILMLAACGNEPPCTDAAVVHTVRTMAASLIVEISVPQKLPEAIDLTRAVPLDAIIVEQWDANLKSAVCSARYKLDHSVLWRDAKAASSRVSDPALKQSLEGLNTDLSGVIVGRLVYSVRPTSDKNWWITLNAMQPD